MTMMTTLDRRFAATAADRPADVAVLDGERALTYDELRQRSARIRGALAARGVRPGDAVGVCMDRSAELPAVLLGILAAGAAYVPLDVRWPVERRRRVRLDARLAYTVYDRVPEEDLAAVPQQVGGCAELLAHPPDPAAHASRTEGIAYVLYTSGTTGEPKGVEVTHGNITALLEAMERLLGADAARRALFSTRLTFDIAALEIFLPLTRGGTCVVAPDSALLSPRRLAALVNRAAPTLVQATPIGWRLLLDSGALLSAHQVLVCGGDVLPPDLHRRLAELPAPAYNLYGPTEATVWATSSPIAGQEVSIGTALAHTSLRVLDERLEPTAPGLVGELYLGGPAIALGYRGRPELTAARFVADPWGDEPGARMYATGDLVRLVDGRLRFVGRNDTQIKLNGHRIELGELEAVALEADGVSAAVAVLAHGSTDSIHLYLASALPEERLRADIVERLARLVPSAAMPGAVHVAESLPVTANGKIDRALLKKRACLNPPAPALAERHDS